MSYLYLAVAIAAEVVATSLLKASDGFTRLGASAGAVLGYAVAFYFLSLCLRAMPVEVAYAIWSGVGIVLLALVGLLWFGQRLDAPAILGLGLIVSGVVILNVWSSTIGD